MEVTVIKLKNITDKELITTIVFDMIQFLSEEEIENFSFVETSDKKYEFVFVILDQARTERLINLYNDHDVLISSNQITYQVLMGTAFENVMFANTFKADTNQRKVLDSFIEANLTKDIILDKISEKLQLLDIDIRILQS
jgi:hypothetical protein